MIDGMYEIDVKMSCQKKNWVTETLYAQYRQQPNGGLEFLGMNICNNGCGDDVCEKCRESACKKLSEKIKSNRSKLP